MALSYSLAVAASSSYSITVDARNAQGQSAASAAVAGTTPPAGRVIVKLARKLAKAKQRAAQGR